jgi:diguanylate cyclase (GGDEF)-like protein
LLIVDDISDNRAILTRRFERRGFEVIEAESGFAAIDMIESEAFDLVLLDIMMPGIDGIETLKRIRSRNSASILPVIMVTAKSESENIVGALEVGANDYVTKPVDFAVALARVNTQLIRRQAELNVATANEALRAANETLETRVADRTSRLIEANMRLRSEIVDREQSDARSQYLAYHDTLTALGNRLMFREQLDEALRASEQGGPPVAVLFIDLDGFKAVNDSLGHSVGDSLLKVIADRMRNAIEPSDRIARLGGDEFAILQSGVPQPASARRLAQTLVEIVARPCAVDGYDVNVGASIGVALGEPGTTGDHLLKSADIAMYAAKGEGRGTFRVFDPQMESIMLARRSMERDLRNGFVKNGFRLLYQPLVNLQTNKVTAFEALMRWQHPARGSVSPSEFIPVAEDIGLIIQLGEWALRQACEEAVSWPAHVSVSVNLSPIQFLKGNLASVVMNALANSGLSPSRLELEITESVLLEKSERNIETLSQLRALGVRISIDDFGTGYSSISYLRNFRFDKLKIDKSFVKDVMTDEGSLAIVRAIAGLGISFGITTTAEGVETEEQMQRLNMEGCVEAQGFLFSAPIPASKVPQVLADLEARSRPSY